ncbi:hypothetical protein O9992_26715 [Vibrio lentus]|nr:hypothetical protein [Vibrio lentus]
MEFSKEGGLYANVTLNDVRDGRWRAGACQAKSVSRAFYWGYTAMMEIYCKPPARFVLLCLAGERYRFNSCALYCRCTFRETHHKLAR